MLRREIAARIEAALAAAVPQSPPPPIALETPPHPDAGDYATDVAVAVGRNLRDASRGRQVAEEVAAALRAGSADLLREVEVVGAGRLRLRLAPAACARALRQALEAGTHYGRAPAPVVQKILLEYVSANPNTPVTVQHARGGVLGDLLARVLAARGHQVTREYYVNDAPGESLRRFARAVAGGASDPGYPDAYVAEIAAAARLAPGADPDRALPAVLATVRARQDAALQTLGVRFDSIVSEAALHASGAVQETLAALEARGHTVVRGDGLWLRAAALGDAQDRVLRRASGEATYLAADLAYHRDKFARGFDTLVDIWDADHQDYLPRTRAGLAALGIDPARLQVLVTGPVRVLQDGVERRGGRYGALVPLEELLEEIEPEALRLLLAQRPAEEPLDLDLDRALPGENNPASRLAAARRRTADVGSNPLPDAATLLEAPETAALLRAVLELPGEVEAAADRLAPHRIVGYALDLAERIQAVEGSDPARRGLLAVAGIALAAASRLLGKEA